MNKKRLDQKDTVDFKIYDVTAWLKNNYNTHVAEYLMNKGNQTMKLGQIIEYNKRNILFSKIM